MRENPYRGVIGCVWITLLNPQGVIIKVSQEAAMSMNTVMVFILSAVSAHCSTLSCHSPFFGPCHSHTYHVYTYLAEKEDA